MSDKVTIEAFIEEVGGDARPSSPAKVSIKALGEMVPGELAVSKGDARRLGAMLYERVRITIERVDPATPTHREDGGGGGA